MIELAHYKKNDVRLSAFAIGTSIVVIITQLLGMGLNLWLHHPWIACLNVVGFVGFMPTLFLHGIRYLQAKWERPAVWIQNEKLYVISPVHFSMPMDDIASWRIVSRFWFTRYYDFVALKPRKGKERLIGLEFVGQQDRFLAYLEHLFGQQTEPTAANAAVKG